MNDGDEYSGDRRKVPYSNVGDTEILRLQLLALSKQLEAHQRQQEVAEQKADIAKNEILRRLTELEMQVLRADTARRVLIWLAASVLAGGGAILAAWDRVAK